MRASERDGGDAPSTKTGLAAGASHNWRQPVRALAGLSLLWLCLDACRHREPAAEACPAPARLSRLSGQCVPRWASLRRGDVNARKGPGADYPVLWAYHARGLPVQIVGETQIWRRVCDSDGLAAWVDRVTLSDRRAVKPMGTSPVPVLAAPRTGAPVRGRLSVGALAGLDRCEGAWCRVTVAGVTGWAPAGVLWGVAADAQCR